MTSLNLSFIYEMYMITYTYLPKVLEEFSKAMYVKMHHKLEELKLYIYYIQ